MWNRMSIVLSLFAIAILTGLGGYLVAAQRREKKAAPGVVLGTEMAKALEAEQKRKQAGINEKSPLPATQYDFWRGEMYLVNPAPSQLDAKLSEVCQSFARSDAKQRTAMRASLSMDDFYTLLTYSKRSAVFALREHRAEHAVNGLNALAMIELERIDFRDLIVSLGLLHHVANRIGQNAEQLLRSTADLAEPNVARLINQFIQRPANEKNLRQLAGYEEVQTKNGIGLANWQFGVYQPNSPLSQVATEIADLLATDKYQPHWVTLATGPVIPPVWLRSATSNQVDEGLLRAVRGGASVSAKPRPAGAAKSEYQMLNVFLAETTDADTAQKLLALSQQKSPADFVRLGVAEQNLFCLVVSSSALQGEKPLDTADGLNRFSKGIADILRRHGK
jgi:hypothetical protein